MECLHAYICFGITTCAKDASVYSCVVALYWHATIFAKVIATVVQLVHAHHDNLHSACF